MASKLDDAAIAKLKKQHGPELYLIEVEGKNPGDDLLLFVFKKPDRTILAAVTKVGRDDPFAAAEVMIKNCLVWGDAAILQDVAVFSAVSFHFEEINKARASTLKNL